MQKAHPNAAGFCRAQDRYSESATTAPLAVASVLAVLVEDRQKSRRDLIELGHQVGVKM